MAQTATIKVSGEYLTLYINNMPVMYLSEIALILTPEKRQELITLLQAGARGEMQIAPLSVNFQDMSRQRG